MINHRDQLYAFPFDGEAERYDPVLDCWSTLDHLKCPSDRLFAKVTLVRGEFYSIDRSIHHPENPLSKDSMSERCSWQTVLSSHEGCRVGSCVVAAGNHLYVCGGSLEDDFALES